MSDKPPPTKLGCSLCVVGLLWLGLQFGVMVLGEGPHGPKGEMQAAIQEPGAFLYFLPPGIIFLIGASLLLREEPKN